MEPRPRIMNKRNESMNPPSTKIAMLFSPFPSRREGRGEEVIHKATNGAVLLPLLGERAGVRGRLFFLFLVLLGSLGLASSLDAAPINDMFANATVLTGSSVTVSGSNVGATLEAGEPPKAGNRGGASVWWFWTAPASESVTISTAGSSFDTIMGIFTGSSVSALTCVAYNDDIQPGVILQSKVTFNAVAGTRYAIGVDGYNGLTGNITLAVTQAPSVGAPISCTYTLSAPSASFAASGGSGGVGVTTASGCSWTASSGASWVTLTAGASGSGNGTVSYSVAANTATSSRSGTMTVAGQTFTVSQSGASCSYALSATSASFTSSGGSGSLNVTTGSGCGWTASSSASWITVTGGASSSGSGTVSYSVAANTSTSSRTGTMTIANQTFTVSQSGSSCTYALSAASASFASSGGSGSVNVTSGAGCGWTASSGAGWITVTAGASGSGNSTVTYSVAANTSTSSRSGTMSIAGQTFTVTESGASCTYAISPASASFSSSGGSGSVTVTATAGCVWVSTSDASWITINSSSGTGNGTASYSVAANTSTSTRSGAITIAGNLTFTVSQAAAAGTSGTPGQLQWVKTMSDLTGGNLIPRGIAADASGNAVVAGYFTGTANFGGGAITSAGGADAFVAKYNAQGSFLWAVQLASVGDDVANAVAIDGQGNVIVTGYYYGTMNFGGVTLSSRANPAGGSSMDIFVAKYSASGALIWAQSFGGAYNDQGFALAVDGGNNVFLAAQVQNTATFGGVTLSSSTYSSDIALAKLTPAGAILWAERWGSSGSYSDYAYGLATDASGNVVVTGQLGGPSNLGGGLTSTGGGFVSKYSTANGSYIWSKVISGAGPTTIAADPSTGNIIISGGCSAGTDFGGGPITATGGGIFLAGYGPSGSYLWAETFTSTLTVANSSDEGTALSFDGSGNLAMAGQVVSPINLGGGALFGNGNLDYVIGEFSISGNSAPVYHWAKRCASGSSVSAGGGIAFDGLGHVLGTGCFQQTIDLGGISATAPAGTYAGLAAQYSK
jgi:hypothetical protein